jgi:hypothetical protein
MSGRTFPHPRPLRRSRPLTPLSRCGCPAPNPFGSRPSTRARSRSLCFQNVRFRFGRGRLRRHLIVERCGPYVSPVKERRTCRCNADVFFVSISRRARARRMYFSLSRMRSLSRAALFRESCARIRLRSHHVATFWVSDRLRSFLRLGSGSRSRAILPALSVHDVTRARIPAN